MTERFAGISKGVDSFGRSPSEPTEDDFRRRGSSWMHSREDLSRPESVPSCSRSRAIADRSSLRRPRSKVFAHRHFHSALHPSFIIRLLFFLDISRRPGRKFTPEEHFVRRLAQHVNSGPVLPCGNLPPKHPHFVRNVTNNFLGKLRIVFEMLGDFRKCSASAKARRKTLRISRFSTASSVFASLSLLSHGNLSVVPFKVS